MRLIPRKAVRTGYSDHLALCWRVTQCMYTHTLHIPTVFALRCCSQGCAEIRWLSQKVGAKPATISGLSGLGDIMLTCYGDLSRNRWVVASLDWRSFPSLSP